MSGERGTVVQQEAVLRSQTLPTTLSSISPSSARDQLSSPVTSLSLSLSPSTTANSVGGVAVATGVSVGLTLVVLAVAAVIVVIILVVCCAVRRRKTRGNYNTATEAGHTPSSVDNSYINSTPVEHIYAEISTTVCFEGSSKPHSLLSGHNTVCLPPQEDEVSMARGYATLHSVRGGSCTPDTHGRALDQQDTVEIPDLPSSPQYWRHSIAAMTIRQVATASQDPFPTEAEEYLCPISAVQQDDTGSEDQATANGKSWRLSWPSYSHMLTQTYPTNVDLLQRIKSQDL